MSLLVVTCITGVAIEAFGSCFRVCIVKGSRMVSPAVISFVHMFWSKSTIPWWSRYVVISLLVALAALFAASVSLNVSITLLCARKCSVVESWYSYSVYGTGFEDSIEFVLRLGCLGFYEGVDLSLVRMTCWGRTRFSLSRVCVWAII